MVIRLFLSAVAEGDLDQVLALLKEDVVPAFQGHPDCLGIEVVMAEAAGVGGLVEGGVITRWTSTEAMESALVSPELTESQVRVRRLLRREPVRRVFQVID